MLICSLNDINEGEFATIEEVDQHGDVLRIYIYIYVDLYVCADGWSKWMQKKFQPHYLL